MKRILIANRGEIARRIARTCRRMDIGYVAVYSQADAGASYLEGAVASVCIGATQASKSYLNIERLLDVARQTGCDAVHPGYGFLSENPDFARAVTDAGLVFVGPDAQTIAAMGDKARAKALMAEAGVPVIPGSSEASDDPQSVAEMARVVGLPLLLKPAAGGGGKGMETVTAWEDLAAATKSAIRLARSSFGDGRLLVERLVHEPRHIEVQIFGDAHGNVVHLFERECSLQRRHQKIVEEAPAARLDSQVRDRLLAAAVRGARAIGYRNAGTFEFIVGSDGPFYFLEVNTRLQVEHPVTEEITGLDLVEWQLRVAAGEPLPLQQDQIAARGHAIECRVYAEDPSRNFLPTPGRVQRVVWPERLRVETALADGDEVSSHYDPMVAKLVVHAADRAEALRAMRDRLQRSWIFGLTTNIGFLARLLAEPAVSEGTVHTQWIDENLARFSGQGEWTGKAIACAATALAVGSNRQEIGPAARSPWSSAALVGLVDRSGLDPGAPFGRIALRCDKQWAVASLISVCGSSARVAIGDGDGPTHDVTAQFSDGIWSGAVDGAVWSALRMRRAFELVVAGERIRLGTEHDGAEPDGDGQGGLLAAPMSGQVAAVNANVGDVVVRGEVLVVIEAMKMENPVVAACDGVVRQVMVEKGASVNGGQVLLQVESA